MFDNTLQDEDFEFPTLLLNIVVEVNIVKLYSNDNKQYI